MKLKPIPSDTVVHTPTEKEAKLLLAILHENGYKWNTRDALYEFTKWDSKNNKTCYKIYIGVMAVTYSDTDYFEKNEEPILTLAEFKKRYADFDDNLTDDCKSPVKVEEKPQSKFKVGDKVMIDGVTNLALNHHLGKILELPNTDHPSTYKVRVIKGYAFLEEVYLTPYAEPETKDEAKEAKGETKELNLCELLIEHEKEIFFSLAYGEVILDEIRRGTQRGDSTDFLCVRSTSFDSGTIIVNPNGKLRNAGIVDLVPSRALYEKFPLDAYAAWMEWKREQKDFGLFIKTETYVEGEYGWEDCNDNESHLHFHTPADRDKCIEEIKTIVEKYSK